MVLDTIDGNVMCIPTRGHEPSAVVFVGIQLQLTGRNSIFSLYKLCNRTMDMTNTYGNRVVGNNIVVTEGRVPGDVEGLGSVHVDETFLEVLVVLYRKIVVNT